MSIIVFNERGLFTITEITRKTEHFFWDHPYVQGSFKLFMLVIQIRITFNTQHIETAHLMMLENKQNHLPYIPSRETNYT